MGQAKRRRNELQAWNAALSDEERTIADISQRLLQRFIEPRNATGMCYRLTYFLHLYFLQRGIATTPVIGYVNDGTDDIFMSHAWLEYRGKKTDLTLGQTERPDLNAPGNVLILEFLVRRAHNYSYHLTKSPEAIALEDEFLADPVQAGVVRHKATEHIIMTDRASNPVEMRRFLDSAPDGFTYDRLASIIE